MTPNHNDMDYKRPDGRLLNEMRDVSVSFDGLDGVDGSARFGFGETKALASISGPIEVRLAAEQASRATFEVIVRPLTGLPGTEAKALASSLRSALLPSMILTNNPRTLIQLVAQSLTPVHTSNDRRTASLFSSGPALVAATINSASLALLNASSIPLRGVICAAAVGRLREGHSLVADPAENELQSLNGAGVFAFLITDEKTTQGVPQAKADLVWSNWSATPFDETELAHATELARAGALRVRQHMKDAISRAVFGVSTKAKVESEARKVESLDDDKMEIS